MEVLTMKNGKQPAAVIAATHDEPWKVEDRGEEPAIAVL
jgi:hypothetical protein